MHFLRNRYGCDVNYVRSCKLYRVHGNAFQSEGKSPPIPWSSRFPGSGIHEVNGYSFSNSSFFVSQKILVEKNAEETNLKIFVFLLCPLINVKICEIKQYIILVFLFTMHGPYSEPRKSLFLSENRNNGILICPKVWRLGSIRTLSCIVISL